MSASAMPGHIDMQILRQKMESQMESQADVDVTMSGPSPMKVHSAVLTCHCL